MRDFQRNKRHRQGHLAHLHHDLKHKKDAANSSAAPSGPSTAPAAAAVRTDQSPSAAAAAMSAITPDSAGGDNDPTSQQSAAKIARKLTFGQSEHQPLFVAEYEEDDIGFGHPEPVSPMPGRSPGGKDGSVLGGAAGARRGQGFNRQHQQGVTAAGISVTGPDNDDEHMGAKVETQDNLLHLDLTKLMEAKQQQMQVRSAPPNVPPPGAGGGGSQGGRDSKTSSFHFNADK